MLYYLCSENKAHAKSGFSRDMAQMLREQQHTVFILIRALKKKQLDLGMPLGSVWYM